MIHWLIQKYFQFDKFLLNFFNKAKKNKKTKGCYIVEFENEIEMKAFVAKVKKDKKFLKVKFDLSEMFPTLIIKNVSKKDLEIFRSIAPYDTLFFPDFQLQTFSSF